MSDAACLLHQDRRFAAATERAACLNYGDRHKKKLNREFTHFHLCFFLFFLSEQDFDACESGPGQGAEA